MRIPRKGELFTVEMDGLKVVFSPLTGREKIELAHFVSYESGKPKIDRPRQEHFLIKCCVKEIKGLKNFDDEEYKLEFESTTNRLTDDCADEVLSFLSSTWFTTAVSQFTGIGEDGTVINPITFEPIEGLKVTRLIPKKDEEIESGPKK